MVFSHFMCPKKSDMIETADFAVGPETEKLLIV